MICVGMIYSKREDRITFTMKLLTCINNITTGIIATVFTSKTNPVMKTVNRQMGTSGPTLVFPNESPWEYLLVELTPTTNQPPTGTNSGAKRD